LFESFIKQHSQSAWWQALEALTSSIHDVDRNATTIWFHFFPLALADALGGTANPAEIAQKLRLAGQYRIAEQIDTSHWFLYGHRYWPQVKAAIIQRADSGTAPSSLDLAAVIRDLAAGLADDPSLVLGIAAVGLMTLQQVGLEAFRASGDGRSDRAGGLGLGFLQGTPAQILGARHKNDRQGVAGLWRGIRSHFTVTFDERRRDGRFTIINQQHLTTGSASDRRPYTSGPRTCIEGPIPVECRTASCGTCWVGVIAGAERLSEVDSHEARRMKEFGYINSAEPRPLVRLACAAVASGNVTIVIPPWNGFIGARTGSRETSAAPRA
jgi:ferredoxin